LARPRHGLEEIRHRAEGIDIMLAIDLSGSMSAYDIPKNVSTQGELEALMKSGALKNRIAIAKAEIRKFIEARPNDRIGLIGFGPLPYAACPPTLDHAWLLAHLDSLDAGIIGDGTGIAGPIASATQRLKASEAKRRIVVLFTDGSNNVNAKVTPRQAAKLASSFDVIVYTVGIGSPNAAVLRDGFFGRQFVQLQDEFDEPLLRDISSTTGGRYYKASDAEGMAQAMSEIDKLEKTAWSSRA
jgi:Ca-activated chloride channel family protein